MSPAPVEQTLLESVSETPVDENRRFAHLRGVQWRINLGILPSSSSSSVDDLRRVTADSRRRYATLRRRLLVDPHLPKDGSNSPNPVMDNPLSQNPDSTWGRFFRNAELEKMVDQDLSRLYPEHGSYFQAPGCQGTLRRILLLWCLRHPEYGYRQGMHELLAPLLYVLHVDVEHLAQVRELYKDHFTDKFDGLSFEENDIYNFDFKKFLDCMEDETGSNANSKKGQSVDELDFETQTIVLLTDAYGAEGELGVVLSEKFIEHDAYCMFDALMNGGNGSVAMAEFFAPSLAGGSHTGSSPVIEASAALYHLLSVVDASLHSHLVELGVEPQYFALRWLRVLFGREFSLEHLLLIWDEIFAADNKVGKGVEDAMGCGFRTFSSTRGALISSIAVSMILYLRSSLLATENATSCLQRLLNFPENINLRKLLDKAKSLLAVALDTNNLSSSTSFTGPYNKSKSMVVRGHTHSLSSDSVSPKTPLNVFPDSYWEEKWRVLHKAEELRQNSSGKQSPTPRKGWSAKVRLSLSRAESVPTPAKADSGRMDLKSSVRRSLLEDLSRELGSEEDVENIVCHEVSGPKDQLSEEVELEREYGLNKDICSVEGTCPSQSSGSEENSSIFSDPASPVSGPNNGENDSEKSSIASNTSLDEDRSQPQNFLEENSHESQPQSLAEESSRLPDGLLLSGDDSQNSPHNDESTGKTVAGMKERKLLLGRFQWFWKFGRNTAGEETSDKGGTPPEASKSANPGDDQSTVAVSPSIDGLSSSSKGDALDQNVMGTLKNLGQSMLEHIQVIESVFQPDRENSSKNVLVGKGQATAVTALKELRKISNLLSEM